MRTLSVIPLFMAFVAFGTGVCRAERVTAAGKVVDADGKPIEHAAVLVYSAGVKKGFNLFCPTCYVDCGKRTFTAEDGSYSIPGLSPDLAFNLLVIRDGYGTTFVNTVDPLNGPAATAVLKKRTSPEDPAQVARGKVLDPQGSPVGDALVEQHGAVFTNGGRTFGDPGWLDLVAVTNDRGEFEIAHTKPLKAAILQVSPRGMSSKLVTVPTGSERKNITVTEGATIRGRLVQNGKPVANAEIGLRSHSSNSEDYIAEVRIGTDEDGKFAITSVPAGRVWYLYGKMESLAPLGLAADIVECATKDDGQEVNVGDVAVRPAFTFRGRIVLSDGKPIPPGMHVNLISDRLQDSQTLTLTPDGAFEFKGITRGVYMIIPAVKGYRPHNGPPMLETLFEGDVSNWAAVLEPVTPSKN